MKLRRTHIIANVNHKGGCGKTTTTVNTAAALAEQGYHVCAVGIDEQCNMSTGLGIDINAHSKAGKYTCLDIYLNKRQGREICVPIVDEHKQPRFEGRMRVIPGHRQLNSVKAQLDAELHTGLLHENASELDEDEIKDEQRRRLKVSLDTLRKEFDVVLIDTPPDLGFLTTTALLAADWVIIPVFPSAYDLDGLQKLQETRKKVARRYNQQLNFLGVLLGRVDLTAKLDIEIYNMLIDIFGEKVFETKITSSVRQREAPAYGLTVLEHAPEQSGAEQFRQFAREVIARLEKADADRVNTESPNQISDGQRMEVNQPI